MASFLLIRGAKKTKNIISTVLGIVGIKFFLLYLRIWSMVIAPQIKFGRPVRQRLLSDPLRASVDGLCAKITLVRTLTSFHPSHNKIDPPHSSELPVQIYNNTSACLAKLQLFKQNIVCHALYQFPSQMQDICPKIFLIKMLPKCTKMHISSLIL